MLTWVLLPMCLAAEVPTIYGAPRDRPATADTYADDLEIELSAGWATDYVFRGIEILEPLGREDSGVYPIAGRVTFNADGDVRPFAELFAMAGESDPADPLLHYRPTVGVELDATEALTITVGHGSYFYPEAAALRTNELFVDARLTFPLGSTWAPWQIFGKVAYDYDNFDGVYGEAGLVFDVPMLDPGFARLEAAVAAVDGYDELFGGDGSGLQHYRVGVVAGYELNELLNLSRDDAVWNVEARLFYTDGIDSDLRADTQLWGGVGIGVRF